MSSCYALLPWLTLAYWLTLAASINLLPRKRPYLRNNGQTSSQVTE